MYLLLTGTDPFQGLSAHVIIRHKMQPHTDYFKPPQWLQAVQHPLLHSFDALMQRCTNRDRRAR